jgi:hypothetical protein
MEKERDGGDEFEESQKYSADSATNGERWHIEKRT